MDCLTNIMIFWQFNIVTLSHWLTTINDDNEDAEIRSLLTISINFIDHVLQFCLCWILTQWPHNSTQLLCRNGAITIFVKQRERLFELCTIWQITLMYQCTCSNNNNANMPFIRSLTLCGITYVWLGASHFYTFNTFAALCMCSSCTILIITREHSYEFKPLPMPFVIQRHIPPKHSSATHFIFNA